MKLHHTDIFPLTLPFNEPPPVRRTLHKEYLTPLYGLAWVCTSRQLLELAGPEPSRSTPSEIFTIRWSKITSLTYDFKPQVHLAINAKNYLVVMFNAPKTDHEKRVGDPADDLIATAKAAMAITPDLEPSFMWYRFPLDWVLDA